MLAQIVIHYQNITSLGAEIFRHSASGIRSDILKRCAFRRGCRHYNRIIHCSRTLQLCAELNDRRAFLTDCNINTYYILILLVYNCIYCNLRFSGLTVSDYKLSLTASDRYHTVNRLDSGLKRNRHAFSLDNSGGFSLYGIFLTTVYLSLPIDRMPESVHNPAE